MPTNYEPLVLTIEPAYVGSAVSPTVDITETSDDVTVTITDINGEHSYTVEKTDQAIADAQAAASAANSAASAASTAATRANTSADNADTATTAANIAAAAATAATVDTEAATAAANSAASSATSAAANANAAADRVDTAIDDAESAATAANSAATSATNAASAANSAASNANSKATLANTAATNANTKAGLANTAANAANSAAQSASSAASTASTAATNADAKATAANTAASAANTAATAANDAAARVDTALETLDDDLKITDSASGETVTAADASYLNTLVVDGKSVQDGTPTPENPVPVRVAKGRNLLPNTVQSQTTNGITFTVNTDGTVTANGTATAAAFFNMPSTTGFVLPAGTYTLSGTPANSGYSAYMRIRDVDHSAYLPANDIGNGATFTINEPTTVYVFIRIETGYVANNVVFKPQIEFGANKTPYVPYGCIGLQIGNTVTPIDLKGNVLASLPDGTHDVLNIDSAGHKLIEKNTGYIVSYNGESVGDVYISTTGELSTGASVYYKLATTATIDMGYITPPAIASGSVISILATLTPTITPTWWTSRAAAIPEALAVSQQHIEDTSADDASIAPVESSTAVANHSVGALIMLDGMLYKVTTAIATGEAITPGTNCTQTTVAAELAALA